MIVKGSDVLLKIGGDDWGCARSVSLSMNTDVLETLEYYVNGKYKTFIPAQISASATLEGLASLGGALLTVKDLFQLQQSQTVFEIIFFMTDGTNDMTVTTNGFIVSFTSDSSFDNVSTFNLTLQITGNIVTT